VLKHRILTAAFLIPFFIWGIFSLSTQHFAYMIGAFVSVGAWEWTRLIGIRNISFRGLYVVLIVGIQFILLDHLSDSLVLDVALIASGVFWLFALYLIISYRGQKGVSQSLLPLNLLIGVILLVPTWLALLTLHGRIIDGAEWLLFALSIIWVADSAAYFVGRKFGKNKLAPHVSPGKSREGVMGAVVASLIYSLLAGVYWLGVPDTKLLSFMFLCMVVVIVSVEGDLLESLYKRRVGVKDSGIILPGHGGVLDRIDSVMAAVPVFVLGTRLLEI